MSRRARQINDLKRNRAKQASYDRVLIVCEGSKTEPNYFREIIDHSVRLQQEYFSTSGDPNGAPRRTIVVAFQGGEGAYSHLAATRHFGARDAKVIYEGFPSCRSPRSTASSRTRWRWRSAEPSWPRSPTATPRPTATRRSRCGA